MRTGLNTKTMQTYRARIVEEEATRVKRRTLTPDQTAHWRKSCSTEELLRMALTMLDKAAEEQTGNRWNCWLHDNMTLEVIRDRVES